MRERFSARSSYAGDSWLAANSFGVRSSLAAYLPVGQVARRVGSAVPLGCAFALIAAPASAARAASDLGSSSAAPVRAPAVLSTHDAAARAPGGGRGTLAVAVITQPAKASAAPVNNPAAPNATAATASAAGATAAET